MNLLLRSLKGIITAINILHALITKESFLTSMFNRFVEPNKDSVLLETSTSVDANAGL